MENLARHVRNVQGYGVPAVVAINRFSADTEAERALVADACAEMGVKAVECDHWAMGGAGCEALAHEVVGTIEGTPSNFQPLYPDEMTLWEKIETVAKRIYGADGIVADDKVRRPARRPPGRRLFGHFPVCMAKTQYSFSTDAALKNAPSGFEVPIREVRLSGGAEFVVAICGAIMTMPGLPRTPAADTIAVNEAGHITGLF